MLDETLVVKSATSAFNNVALYTPAFLWWAILAVPVFALVWFCGSAIVSRLGWTRSVLLNRIAIVSVVLTMIWIVLFGGNYAVLRDGTSVLPFSIAGILFVCAMFLGSHFSGRVLEIWRNSDKKRKVKMALSVALILVVLGLSDMHTWWGPLLQIGCVLLGCVLGRLARSPMRVIPGTLLIMFVTTTVILMQPEFFRFGQLGALTLAHIVAVALCGASMVASFVARNIDARARISDGVYIKLKWLMRCATLLGFVLFLMTESVPVFFGFMFILLIKFSLSVYHSKTSWTSFGEQMFVISLGLFGIITGMLAVSVLAVLYYSQISPEGLKRQVRALL